MIHDTARRADDDLRALLQPAKLAIIGLPAVNGQLPHTAPEESQLGHFFGHLDGEFARGAKDQNLRGAQRGIDPPPEWAPPPRNRAWQSLSAVPAKARVRKKVSFAFGLVSRDCAWGEHYPHPAYFAEAAMESRERLGVRRRTLSITHNFAKPGVQTFSGPYLLSS